jgi:hypothetical protein
MDPVVKTAADYRTFRIGPGEESALLTGSRVPS